MSLPRNRILRDRADFLRVRSAGQAKPGRFLLFTALRLEPPANPAMASLAPATEFGFITPKYVGKAHDRNLVRRRLRAIVRAHLRRLQSGYHVVLLARKRISEAGYAELEAEFLRLAGKSGVLKPETHPSSQGGAP